MSDINFSGVDFGFAFDENFNRDLAAYFQTPEGQANLAASGLGGINIPDAAVPGTPTDSNVVGRDFFDAAGDRQGSFFDGSGQLISATTPALDEPDSGPPAPMQPMFSPNPDARNTIKAVLSTYGLESLAETLWGSYTSGLVDINNEQALVFSIRDTEQYKTRFSANAARMKRGLAELSPSEYIGLEDSYRQIMQSNGMPPGFYDQNDDFSKLIEGDVSPSELQNRVQQGYAVVAQADPEVRRQMQTLYGVTEGQLAAYFIDPERTAPLLKQQAQAAQIAARGLEQGGIQLTGEFAENLAARGITEQQARAGFAEVGALGELRQTFAGETELSGEQVAGAAFGIDVAAQQELERKRRLRTGEFAGGGSFARTTGETSGSISTAVGRAQ
jgi:hypothetical protein